MKKHPQFIVVDLFCGAGGTSVGFARAKVKGVPVAEVIACVNHDALAIRNHSLNFPNCVHFTEDVRKMDLTRLLEIVQKYRRLYPGAKLILWASLECTHFSNAKTGSRNADSRTLAWVLYDYIRVLCPELVMVENVREFMSWGPLVPKVVKVKTPTTYEDDNWQSVEVLGDYCPVTFNKKTGQVEGVFVPEDRKKGRDYLNWRQTIEGYGYRYRSKLINSADLGSHQSRLRYFAAFAVPGMPIVFPEQTHHKDGKNGLKKWKPVREVLDLGEVGASIFKRKKPLSPNTLKRILAGLVKFVAKGQNSYLIKNYGGDPDGKAVSLDAPAPTLTTIPHEMVITADFLCQYNGKAEASVTSTGSPCRTLTTNDRFGLVQIEGVFIDNQHTHSGDFRGPSSLDVPAGTLTTVNKKALVHAAFLDRQFGQSEGASLDEPCGTLATEPKTNLVHAEFLVPTNYGNEPTSLDEPAPTLTANRKWLYVVNTAWDSDKTQQYLLNPQYENKGASIEEPCFTLIAKMDKMPPYLVTVQPGPDQPENLYLVDMSYFKDGSIDVETRIRVFMAVFGISDIYMRMLNIPELKRIQGLNIEGEPEYILTGPKNEQKKHIGNAVVPYVVTKWMLDYYQELSGNVQRPQLTLF